MANNSVYEVASLINKQENLKLGISKAKALAELLSSINLNEHSHSNIHLCLVILSEQLSSMDKYFEKVDVFS